MNGMTAAQTSAKTNKSLQGKRQRKPPQGYCCNSFPLINLHTFRPPRRSLPPLEPREKSLSSAGARGGAALSSPPPRTRLSSSSSFTSSSSSSSSRSRTPEAMSRSRMYSSTLSSARTRLPSPEMDVGCRHSGQTMSLSSPRGRERTSRQLSQKLCPQRSSLGHRRPALKVR
ncbi:hypothetical protein EYF80_042551 [Liparis tanakae]|uniref:Uncharacterized protein n=1 Tax=Liparis tanakae TaxID=230148 RepID=A0A4Z2G2X4_9TELE|nr:hypothetical protein EYF80_042551 [Liparis tanakae]